MATVKDIENLIRVQALDALDDKVTQIAGKINAEVVKQNQSFMQILLGGVDKYPGAAGVKPDLGGYGRAWSPLTEKYRDWKAAKSLSENFYAKHGKMKGEIAGMDTKAIFGDVVTRVFGGPQGDRDTVVAAVTRGGITRTVGRNAKTGRFAKLSTVFQNVKYYIDVLPLPKVVNADGSDGHSVESVFAAGDEVLFFKLTGGQRGHVLRMDRPLVGPFVSWWVKVWLKQRIQGITK